jgi:uncharacterized membrane protein
MNGLILSLIAFIGTHFLLSHPLRKPIVSRVGEGVFQGVYSVVAFATFYGVYVAFAASERGVEYWPVGDAIWAVASGLMLLGSILFAGSFIRNPAMMKPEAIANGAIAPHGVFAITRHPMMWGFALWAIVHILVAPYAANIVLCLGMMILALGGSLGQDRKKSQLMGQDWTGWQSRTSFIPFGLHMGGKAHWRTAWPGRTTVLLGTVIWLGASYLHPALGGPIAGIWRWL